MTDDETALELGFEHTRGICCPDGQPATPVTIVWEIDGRNQHLDQLDEPRTSQGKPGSKRPDHER
ncbi:hypothetical protein [Pseudarthrobacter sp. LMD1-1-1.1]|uniref:hypothetical protein n=1 Tax=Pseudarthrobacter sp. LMD1-1-1.1 TaxID=3135242 RepID=UPI00342BE2F6